MSQSLKPQTVKAPSLDDRSAADLVAQCEILAQTLTPQWSQYWSSGSEKEDVGRAMFRLFGSLGEYVVNQLNQVSNQRKLYFLRFFGITPRPPMAAIAMLSFTHTPGESSVVLPAGTRVDHIPSEEVQIETQDIDQEVSDQSELNEEERQIVFQTTNPLKVVPATITAAYTVEPSQDGYIDQSPTEENPTGGPYHIFGPQPLTPNDHLFLIGDSQLFAPGYAPNGFTLILTGYNLLTQWFQLWFDGNGVPLQVDFDQAKDGSRLEIRFAPLPEERTAGTYQDAINAVLGVEGEDEEEPAEEEDEDAPSPPFWLVGRPMQGLPILPGQEFLTPYIDRIQCCIPASGLFPLATFYNDTELDIVQGAQPFGETPALEDSFYIASDAVLAKSGSSVRIDFSLSAIQTPPDQFVTAILAWEFWNGEVWSNFEDPKNAQYAFVNRSNNFYADNPTGGTYVSFICPPMPKLDIGGVESYWIRARIASGNYGAGFDFTPYSNAQIVEMIPSNYLIDPTKKQLIEELDTTPGFTFGYVVSDSQYFPPYILSMHLQYDFSAEPAQTVAYNDYQTRNLFRQPYQPMDGTLSSFMIGFEPDGFAEYTVGNDLTLFFELQNQTAVGDDEEASEDAMDQVIWSYFNGYQWKIITVKDGAEGLSRSGIVSLSLGSDMRVASFFGHEAYWIRLQSAIDHIACPIVVSGIWPNSVQAQNYVTILDEVVGSGNGEPSQSFALSSPFVLNGQTIEVIETSFPTQEERNQSQKENFELKVRNVLQPDGSNLIYITWNEVNDFATSTSLSRHYTIDRRTGVITFGNGQKGMVAPTGENNIIAAKYDSSLGAVGNVAAGTITSMEDTVPQITAVTNPIDAAAGRSGDMDTTTAQVGPWQMRNNNLAVTSTDYEQLAIMSDTAITKAAVCTDTSGMIQVYIYIHTHCRDGSHSKPSPDILDETASFIRQRMLFDLQSKLRVNPPHYEVVNIYTKIMIQDRAEKVRDQVEKTLQTYFDLEIGGPEKEGWEFGEPIMVQDVVSAVLNTEGVDLVDFLSVNSEEESLLIGFSSLPILGDIQIEVVREVDFGN